MRINARFATFAVLATLSIGAYFATPASEAEAKCRPSNPCANGTTAVIKCPGGDIAVSGNAEVVCKPYSGGGQLVGIVGGGTNPLPDVRPTREVRAENPVQKPTPRTIRREQPVQASVSGKNLPSRGYCNSGAFQGDSMSILILPCPKGSSVNFVAGVPGQAQLIRNGLIALQNSGAAPGCLWLKQIRSTSGMDITFHAVPVRQLAKYVVFPGKGVLRPEGKISYNSATGTVAALELTPGACKGRKSKPYSVAELIRIAHGR